MYMFLVFCDFESTWLYICVKNTPQVFVCDCTTPCISTTPTLLPTLSYALSTAIIIKYGRGTHLISIPSSCRCQSTSLSDNRSRICVCGCPAYSFHQNCMQKPENQLKRQWGLNVLSLSFDTKFGTFSSWTDLLCYATVCITTWILHDSITFFLMYILIKNHNHDFSFRTYCINIIYFKGIFALRMKGLHAFLLCYGVHTWNLGWFFFCVCVFF